MSTHFYPYTVKKKRKTIHSFITRNNTQNTDMI